MGKLFSLSYSFCPCPHLSLGDVGIYVQKPWGLWGTYLGWRGRCETVADKPVREASGLAWAVAGGMEGAAVRSILKRTWQGWVTSPQLGVKGKDSRVTDHSQILAW